METLLVPHTMKGEPGTQQRFGFLLRVCDRTWSPLMKLSPSSPRHWPKAFSPLMLSQTHMYSVLELNTERGKKMRASGGRPESSEPRRWEKVSDMWIKGALISLRSLWSGKALTGICLEHYFKQAVRQMIDTSLRPTRKPHLHLTARTDNLLSCQWSLPPQISLYEFIWVENRPFSTFNI